MKIQRISGFNDFVDVMLQVGFSCGGMGDEGAFSVASYYADNICSHTDDPETDPWEWRMRVLNERNDIAYAKLFFGKSGYITKEWYPYFLAVRRKGENFSDMYESGVLSAHAKRVYDVLEKHDRLPSHLIKRYCEFKKEDNSKFQRALTELQMKMLITICGGEQKVSGKGEYGWFSSVFCRTELYFEPDVFTEADKITEAEALRKIEQRVFELNPNADKKKTLKFITG